MHNDKQSAHVAAPASLAGSQPEDRPRVESLQQAVVRLLIRNEAMRFELHAVRRHVAGIERAVFGAGTLGLRRRLPAHLVEAHRALCHEASGDRPTESATAPDNVIAFRSR